MGLLEVCVLANAVVTKQNYFYYILLKREECVHFLC